VLALVYLHAQSKLDAVGDVQPVEGLTAKLGQTPVVLPMFDTTRAAALRTRCYSLSVVFLGAPANSPKQ